MTPSTVSSTASHFDVFNGDADGICALHQLRLYAPCADAELVTGIKRDIQLLSRLRDVRESRITVLDISLDRNRDALVQLLEQDNTVFYADHHYSGNIPLFTSLETHIDPSPLTCTSIIIDALLGGKYRAWAIVGAFGDNLDDVASELAQRLGYSGEQVASLQEMGRLLNYNGYGMAESDLLIHPAALFQEVHRFAEPFDMERDSSILARLRQGYREDMNQATALSPTQSSTAGRVFILPETTWAKRVVGVFSNQLAREEPRLAHATLIERSTGSYLVSVRAPLAIREGADVLCRGFVTGGGRAAAAGINELPAEELGTFLAAFNDQFSEPLP
nr:acetyltransferase [uncultured Desulfobulbus sp.]